jgi:hypothetical protein
MLLQPRSSLENVSLAILKQFLEAKLVENHEKFVSVMKL